MLELTLLHAAMHPQTAHASRACLPLLSLLLVLLLVLLLLLLLLRLVVVVVVVVVLLLLLCFPRSPCCLQFLRVK